MNQELRNEFQIIEEQFKNEIDMFENKVINQDYPLKFSVTNLDELLHEFFYTNLKGYIQKRMMELYENMDLQARNISDSNVLIERFEECLRGELYIYGNQLNYAVNNKLIEGFKKLVKEDEFYFVKRNIENLKDMHFGEVSRLVNDSLFRLRQRNMGFERSKIRSELEELFDKPVNKKEEIERKSAAILAQELIDGNFDVKEEMNEFDDKKSESRRNLEALFYDPEKKEDVVENENVMVFEMKPNELNKKEEVLFDEDKNVNAFEIESNVVVKDDIEEIRKSNNELLFEVAFKTTMEKYGLEHVKTATNKFICDPEEGCMGYTRDNNARDNLLKLTPDDVFEVITNSLIKNGIDVSEYSPQQILDSYYSMMKNMSKDKNFYDIKDKIDMASSLYEVASNDYVQENMRVM